MRGAANKLCSLSEAERAGGVLLVSAGNHGLAVAHCAAPLGIPATIVVARSASPTKVAAIRRYPATLIERGSNYDEAEAAARLLERDSGLTFISPYNDLEVIAGQGTIGLELNEDRPELDAIVVPIGGGGLLAGIAVAAKAMNPKIKVYGAEPDATPKMTSALKAGRIVVIREDDTIADGLAGNIEQGSVTFPIVSELVDDVIVVSEQSIKKAVADAAVIDHLMIEGSAAVALAALTDDKLNGLEVAAVVTGRNINWEVLRQVVDEVKRSDTQ